MKYLQGLLKAFEVLIRILDFEPDPEPAYRLVEQHKLIAYENLRVELNYFFNQRKSETELQEVWRDLNSGAVKFVVSYRRATYKNVDEVLASLKELGAEEVCSDRKSNYENI